MINFLPNVPEMAILAHFYFEYSIFRHRALQRMVLTDYQQFFHWLLLCHPCYSWLKIRKGPLQRSLAFCYGNTFCCPKLVTQEVHEVGSLRLLSVRLHSYRVQRSLCGGV